MMIDWENRSVPLFAVTVSMLAIAVIIVPLRCVLRMHRNAFKIDDWLILVALVFHIGACAVALWGFFYGLDMRDEHLTHDEQEKGAQTFAMFKPIYVVATCFIKCSVCFTFLRLAIDRRIVLSLYMIMGTVVMSSMVMFIGSWLYCRPYHAIWTHWKQPNTEGYCLPGAAVLSFAYIFASVTIVTDLCCAAVPGIILWSSMMPKRTKIMAYITLSLGVTAGFATVCRLPYIMYWVHDSDRSYGLGRIILFELLESGLGIFASCAPALKPLLAHSFSACSTLVARISRWSSVGSSSDYTMEKDNPSRRSIPPPPLPRLDLVIPEPEDTVAEDEESDEEEGREKNGVKLPIIRVQEYRASTSNGVKYTEQWDIV